MAQSESPDQRHAEPERHLPFWLKSLAWLAAGLGLLLQALVFAIGLHAKSGVLVMEICLAIQALAASLLAFAGAHVLPRHLRTPLRWTWVHLWLITFGMPIAGVVIVLFARRIAAAFPKLAIDLPIEFVVEPQFATDLVANVSYGRSARLRAELKNVDADASYRMTALMAMQSMPSRTVSPVLRSMLNDPLDDLRLLAYGMLDKQEKVLMQKILLERPKLLLPLSQVERFAVNKTIAALYSELIYANLVQGDVYRNAADQADVYAAAALEIEPLDAALWRLRGRLALVLERFDQADQMLQRAIACGFSRDRLLPYLAEAAYLRGDYPEVRRLMADLKRESTPMLLPILHYWTS